MPRDPTRSPGNPPPGATGGGEAAQSELEAKLEAELRDLARAVEFPPTPPLAEWVVSRLGDAAAPGRGRRIPVPDLSRLRPVQRGALLAGLALLTAASLVIAAGLGIAGIRIIVGDTPVTPAAASAAPSTPPRSVAPTAPSTGDRLGVGGAVSLETATARAGYRVLIPDDPALGAPDSVHLDTEVEGGMVSLVYAPRPGLPETEAGGVGLLLSQFRGDLNQQLFLKVAREGTAVLPVEVNGGPGYWLEGASHFLYRAPGIPGEAAIREMPLRTVGNALIWEQGDLTIRLEADVPLETALRIAASMDTP